MAHPDLRLQGLAIGDTQLLTTSRGTFNDRLRHGPASSA
jgi:hypothetical protein